MRQEIELYFFCQFSLSYMKMLYVFRSLLSFKYVKFYSRKSPATETKNLIMPDYTWLRTISDYLFILKNTKHVRIFLPSERVSPIAILKRATISVTEKSRCNIPLQNQKKLKINATKLVPPEHFFFPDFR